MPSSDRRLLTPAFLVVTASALAYFFALGVVTPVLPVYVEDRLGGRGAAVGIVVGVFAVSAAVLRPVAGRVGDRHGRGVLIVGGSAVFAVSVLGYGLVESLPWLIAMRLVSGVGEAAVFVGAATIAQDLAPANRRGEAASYFSIAIYGGLGFGPAIGEAVERAWSTDAVWVAAAAFAALAAALGAVVVRLPSPTSGGRVEGAALGRARIFHPAAVGPGLILMLATAGLAAFTAFMPLHALDLGLDGSGAVFVLYSVLVLLVRIFGARVPDRLGAGKAASAALVLQGAGFLLMAAWATTVGLFTSTAVYAFGVSLMYPSLMPLVIAAAPDAERSQAVGTFTLFFDLSQGGGGLLFGVVVSLGGNRSAFAVAGLLCLLGLVVLRRGPVGRAARAERETAAAAAAVVGPPLID